MDRDAVAAGDAELPGAAALGAGDGGFETADSFNDQATATTAASTTRMIMKGSARFILIISRDLQNGVVDCAIQIAVHEYLHFVLAGRPVLR